MIAVNLHDYQRDCRPEDLTIAATQHGAYQAAQPGGAVLVDRR